jgi:hypothetical protein
MVIILMKKTYLLLGSILILFLSIILHSNEAQAQWSYSLPESESDLEDTVLVLLLPKLEEEVEKYYGESKLIDCWKIVHIKRLIDRQSFFFEAKVRFVTFAERRQPPHDLVTLTLSNYPNDWKITDIKVKNIPIKDIGHYCTR